MKQIALSYFEHPYIILISLIIFVLFFAGLLLRVLSKSNAEHYKEMKNLPFKEGERSNE